MNKFNRRLVKKLLKLVLKENCKRQIEQFRIEKVIKNYNNKL